MGLENEDLSAELEDQVTVDVAVEEEPLPKGSSIRDHLESVWDKHSDEPPKFERQKISGDAGKKPAGAEPSTLKVAAGDTNPLKAPNGWSNEAKTEWSKLPPHVQAAVTKREQDMTVGAQKLQERYGGIHKTVTETAPWFQRHNLTPDQGIQRLSEWYRVLEHIPVEGLQALAKSYNIDLSKLGAAVPQPQVNGVTPPADPRIDQLIARVGSFESAETVRQQSATQEALKSWANGKTHYEAVRSVMGQIIAGAVQMQDASIMDSTGQRIDLDKIYEKAIWMVPEVRALVQKEQERKEADALRTLATH